MSSTASELDSGIREDSLFCYVRRYERLGMERARMVSFTYLRPDMLLRLSLRFGSASSRCSLPRPLNRHLAVFGVRLMVSFPMIHPMFCIVYTPLTQMDLHLAEAAKDCPLVEPQDGVSLLEPHTAQHLF